MTAQEIREKREKLVADMRKLIGPEGACATDEARASFDRMKAEYETLGQQAEDAARAEYLSASERMTLPETQRTEAEDRLAREHPEKAEQRVRGREAFRSYLLGGPMEARTQSTLSGAAGGYAVAPDTSFYGRVLETIKFFGGVEAFGATVFNTATGADLPIATTDDTSNTGAIVAEEGSHASGTNVTLGQKNMKAFLFSSKIVKVSMQLLQDASFDFEAFLGRLFGMRLGRIQNTYFTTGLGTIQPQGIVTGASVGRQGATGFATTVDFTELKRAKHSLDIAYRNGARWMFNDSTALAISLVKDGNGRYLLTDSVREGDPPMLLGHPVVINGDMADMAASAKPIVFGQGSAYYIRRVAGMEVRRLNELYAENGQIGMLAFLRADGGLIDTSAVKLWQNSAA